MDLGQLAFEEGGLLERLGEVGFNRIALQVDLPASELKRKGKGRKPNKGCIR